MDPRSASRGTSLERTRGRVRIAIRWMPGTLGLPSESSSPGIQVGNKSHVSLPSSAGVAAEALAGNPVDRTVSMKVLLGYMETLSERTESCTAPETSLPQRQAPSVRRSGWPGS